MRMNESWPCGLPGMTQRFRHRPWADVGHGQQDVDLAAAEHSVDHAVLIAHDRFLPARVDGEKTARAPDGREAFVDEQPLHVGLVLRRNNGATARPMMGDRSTSQTALPLRRCSAIRFRPGHCCRAAGHFPTSPCRGDREKRRRLCSARRGVADQSRSSK